MGWPSWSGGLALRRGRRTFDHRVLYRVAVLGGPSWSGGLALRRWGGLLTIEFRLEGPFWGGHLALEDWY